MQIQRLKSMKTLIPRAVLFTVVSIVITPPSQADPGRIVTGADSGSASHVKAFTTRTHTTVASFFAYTPGFSGGVRVATGDVNGDGAPDIIVGSGPDAAHVKVFSGRDLSELHSFLPYGSGFTGGIFVAAGDVNGDGFDDIVTGTDAGVNGHVKVFSGTTGQELHSFFAFPGFTGGVRVAAGDINGDGRADIITGAGPGSAPHVKVFDGASLAELRSFLAYSASFSGGVFVAAGDINGDGRVDIITGVGTNAPPHVKAFHGGTLAELQSFFAYPAQFTGGVRVAAGDVNGNGRAEILTVPGSGAAPHVRVLDGLSGSETDSFFAYPETFTNGVFIAAASVKRPRLEINLTRTQEEIQLQWPSGCLCVVEGNTDPANRQGWTVLDVQPAEHGNRLGLLLPAVQKFQVFRLKCDDEAVRAPN
jgi:hypothetical protein